MSLQRRLIRLRQQRSQMQQPGAPAPAATPFDAQSEATIGNLGRNFNDSTLALNQQEEQTKQAYGLDPGYNDPTQNPYSRAALLEQSYKQSQNKGLNNYAAQGQLYAGSTSNMLNSVRSTHDQNLNALRGDYSNRLQTITQKRLAARRALDEGSANANADALTSALKETPDATAAPPAPNLSGLNRRLRALTQRARQQRRIRH